VQDASASVEAASRRDRFFMGIPDNYVAHRSGKNGASHAAVQ